MDNLVNVVVFYQSIEIKKVIQEILRNKYQKILYCEINTNQDQFIKFTEDKTRPLLFIYAFEEPKEAVEFNEIIEKLNDSRNLFNKEHLSLLICCREHREAAYFECSKGRFYSYETFKPIYDMNRIRLSIAQMCDLLTSQDKVHLYEEDKKTIINKLQNVSIQLHEVETSISDEKGIQHELLNELIAEIDKLCSLEPTDSIETMNGHVSKIKPKVENFKAHNQSYFKEIGSKVKGATPSFKKKMPLVLVVDDQNVMLKIITTILKPKGFDVEVATNGAEAINKLKNCKPELVLLDIDMPVLNGIDTLKTMNKMNILDKLPVIMLTSNSDKESFIECRELGAIDYIVKPTNAETLLKKVLAVI
ncbi:response regulator [Shewanella sp. MMG014]|uniref:response regulator n=1 Tax=Shewanella sp. MMG014 TaxID=2822691 RepID=UPI001B35F661|nr:response regulator [Shewanella sp. MMG014]MBQ4888827.1 response regulator [Shewanella sp. MMG014]